MREEKEALITITTIIAAINKQGKVPEMSQETPNLTLTDQLSMELVR